MSEDRDTRAPRAGQRFTPRPRLSPSRRHPPSVPAPPSARELFDQELDRIDARVTAIRGAGRAGFHDGAAHYDQASMVVIRLAALFEDDDHAELLSRVTDDERRGVSAMRNFAAHRGYRAMNDDWLWETVTVQVPQLLDRLRPDGGGPPE